MSNILGILALIMTFGLINFATGKESKVVKYRIGGRKNVAPLFFVDRALSRTHNTRALN
jgi:hypothetical protein